MASMRPPSASKVSSLPVSENTRALLPQLEAAVRQAGALALGTFRAPLKTWTKGKGSPVSEADIAVDALLRQRLTEAEPTFGWLSEESVDDHSRLSARCVWIVDPIDGTRAYVAGQPDWTISGALVEDGRPILGAVFAPVGNEMFLAVAGEGATCNGIPIKVSKGDALAGARVAGPKYRLERLAQHWPEIVAMPRIHSLALRMARVAQGQIDIAFANGDGRDWDLAAADLLVHEAGGELTTMAGGTLTYNRANPVHGALLAAGRSRLRAVIAVLREQPGNFP
jgi:myo-inositol-1(or 4)-monophosphatase